MENWLMIIGAIILISALLYSIKPMYASIGLFLLPAGLIYEEALRERRIRRIDEELPRALLELATLPSHGLRDVIKYLSRGYGPLSDEFKRMERLVKGGIPPEKAMREVSVRSGSALLANAVSIIVTGARSGTRWSELIRGAAEDIEAIIDMEREKNSALALQKYVTILSAGIFVPAALGITERMVWRLAGEGPLEAGPILQAVMQAIPIHIVLLAAMSAVFVALIEGRPRRAIIYGAMLIPLAVGTYLLSGRGLV